MTWIIGIPIIGLGIYCLIKSIKREVTGGGCSGCSGCSNHQCSSKHETPRN
ncbi:FeoB-associated Cys-rich membrane protein [Inediibacterium massiliense]|uniref:FeoB-associated Cys-rich membrane protein n=1 Tax=Inediibacterium massiliense TaxID=1658111 RepID=UPI000DA5EE86|nr:FeoB-associated Cys-rich membrane protein [Inediibacterium massiliense]